MISDGNLIQPCSIVKKVISISFIFKQMPKLSIIVWTIKKQMPQVIGQVQNLSERGTATTLQQ